MIEIKNRFYTQRFYATSLPLSDLFKAVTYTEYKGNVKKIPFWYKRINGHTGVQSLMMSDEELLKMMKSNTRNEVRRAEKEGVIFESGIGGQDFVSHYNAFAEEKGLPTINEDVLRKYNRICITSSYIYMGGVKIVLAMHATLYSEEDKSATLMYSCSPRLEEDVDRKLIGWGNRYLHYQDFLYYREMGAERYEWNGINTDPSMPERYYIGKFKLGFGCEPILSIGLRTPLFVLLHYIKFNLINKLRGK